MSLAHLSRMKGIHMTISLDKRTENAQNALINLLKVEAKKGNDLGDLTAQVILAIDFSGSMDGRFANQEVQELVERALALSLAGLDDNGDIELFFFHNDVFNPETVNANNYGGFVNDWASRHRMGGTDYLPCIRAIRKFAEKKGMLKKGKPPVLVLFATDGATSNERRIQQELVDASSDPIFWQFLGLGYAPRFLKQLDTMGGRKVDNVGLFETANSQQMPDDQFYDQMIGEFFREWLPAARNLNIVTV